MGQMAKAERDRLTPKQISSRPKRPRRASNTKTSSSVGSMPKYECGQTKSYNTKQIPGQFVVSVPRGRVRVP